MFTIKNRDSVRHTLDVIGLKGSLLRLDLGPGEASDPIEESWLEYFQQNTVEWAVIIHENKPASRPVEIRSIGKIAVESGTAEVRPRRPKKRSK